MSSFLAPRRSGASLSLELVSVVNMGPGGGATGAGHADFVLRSLDAERAMQLHRRHHKHKGRARRALDRVLRVAAFFVSRNYFLAHLCWFVVLAFLGGIAIFGIEFPSMPFVDCLFTAVSAVTATGLTVFDFSVARGGTQAVVLLLIVFSGAVFDGLFLLCLRRLLWKKSALLNTIADNPPAFRDNPRGDGASTSSASSAAAAAAAMSVDGGVLSLNSHRMAQFHALLTHRQERSALVALISIVSGYLLSFYGLSFLFLGLYFTISATYRAIIVSRGVAVWWSALFHTVSGFSNAGFSLFRDGLVAWTRCPGALIWLSAVIFFGNTGFPILLHAAVQVVFVVLERLGFQFISKKHIIEYVLKFPRRLTPCMFPRRETIRLLVILTLIFVFQFVSMTATDWTHMTADGETIGAGHRLVNAVFQVTSTRTAGFNSLDLNSLSPSTLVLTIIAMYVSAVPGVVTMRSTRDRSGENKHLPAGHATAISQAQAPSPPADPVPSEEAAMGQLKRMLLFDTAWIFGPFYVISLIEDARMRAYPADFPHFSLLFEIVSAYGTVGLSLGHSGIMSSYSTVLRTGSKLVLCLVMLIGRHRGFPDRIDQSVMPTCLPTQNDPVLAGRGGSIRARRRMSFAEPSSMASSSPPPPFSDIDTSRPPLAASPVFD